MSEKKNYKCKVLVRLVIITDTAMKLEAVLLSLLLWEAMAAPRKKRDIGAVEHEHPHHAVSFFDSFFSFFGGGSDSSPITSARVSCNGEVFILSKIMKKRILSKNNEEANLE